MDQNNKNKNKNWKQLLTELKLKLSKVKSLKKTHRCPRRTAGMSLRKT